MYSECCNAAEHNKHFQLLSTWGQSKIAAVIWPVWLQSLSIAYKQCHRINRQHCRPELSTAHVWQM